MRRIRVAIFTSVILYLIISCFTLFYYNLQRNAEEKGPELLENAKLEIQISCPNKTILTVDLGGSTGNLIWEYMSLLAISRLNPNYSPYIKQEHKEELEELFDTLTIPEITQLPPHCLDYKHAKHVEITDDPKKFPELHKRFKMVIMSEYFALYKEIVEYGVDEIREELRFKSEHKANAIETLKEVKKCFNFSKEVTPMVVGIHFRGSNYEFLLRFKYTNLKEISTYQYYINAMNYFKHKYKAVIFVFVTPESEWLQLNLKHFKGNIIVNPSTNKSGASSNSRAIRDLVLLSECDHIIINYGSFGATAALFNKGVTIGYDLDIPPSQEGTSLVIGISPLIYNWILMNNSIV